MPGSTASWLNNTLQPVEPPALLQKAKSLLESHVLSVRSPLLHLSGPMDLRLVLVATPILLAVGWAGFNIGRAAVGQLQLMLKRARG